MEYPSYSDRFLCCAALTLFSIVLPLTHGVLRGSYSYNLPHPMFCRLRLSHGTRSRTYVHVRFAGPIQAQSAAATFGYESPMQHGQPGTLKNAPSFLCFYVLVNDRAYRTSMTRSIL